MVPIEETVIIACFDFIENNWKIDDSSSGLFKERGMELSLLLYCIPFVYSGQCSAFQRDTLPTHTGIINIESDVRPLQHQLHFITHTHSIQRIFIEEFYVCSSFSLETCPLL